MLFVFISVVGSLGGGGGGEESAKGGADQEHKKSTRSFAGTASTDGKSIVFRRIIGPKDESSIVEGIFIVGLDGSDPHQVSNVQKRGALEFEDFTPAFSPDGKRLVFERTRLEDDHTAVFVQILASSASPEDARQITPWEMNCQDGPEFSPKGDWVLFSCEGEGGPSNLYMVHPEGTGLEQLTNSPDDVHYLGSSFSAEFKGWGEARDTGEKHQ